MMLENQLASMTSFKAIKNVVSGIELHDLQCIDVMKMLCSKRAIVSYATGLGKTVLAAAVMNLLWNEDSSRKFIFIGMSNQRLQTPAKLEAMCKKSVISVSKAKDSLDALFARDYTQFSVLFLTHEALQSDRLLNDLFKHRNEFCGIFIDEAHELSNVHCAKMATILSSMSQCFEYCYALTATPIISSVAQMARLANVVHPTKFPNIRRLTSALNSNQYSIENDPCFWINRTRAEMGSIAKYNGILEWVTPLPYQREWCGGSALMVQCKGYGAEPQVRTLVRCILERAGHRGLIYVNQHQIREWILPFLEKAGIKFGCINGATSLSERAKIIKQFNEEKSLDVIITSVTTALDLDCDYIIFYEFTVEVKQMIGRAHRGLGDKTLDVIFIITDDSPEIDYFINNIYKVSMVIQNILKQDFSEIEQINTEIQHAKI